MRRAHCVMTKDNAETCAKDTERERDKKGAKEMSTALINLNASPGGRIRSEIGSFNQLRKAGNEQSERKRGRLSQKKDTWLIIRERKESWKKRLLFCLEGLQEFF